MLSWLGLDTERRQQPEEGELGGCPLEEGGGLVIAGAVA